MSSHRKKKKVFMDKKIEESWYTLRAGFYVIGHMADANHINEQRCIKAKVVMSFPFDTAYSHQIDSAFFPENLKTP